MNQILYVENKKRNQPANIKTVVLFFSIAIIVLGVILVGQGSYAMIIRHQEEQNKINSQEAKPQVNINKEEDDIVIEVKHDKAIDKIIYQWNNEEQKTILGNNKTNLKETISLPFGTNMLNVKVIDINGKEAEYQKEYVIDGDGKPVIELVLTKDNKIKITAKDTKSLKYIVYTWNNGQETKIEANPQDLKIIEKEVEIPLGQNTLKVEALNKDDIVTTKELDVKGVKSPKIDLAKEGENLVIKVQDDTGIERIDYTINGKPYRIDVSSKNYTSLEYKQKMEPGESLFVVKAINKDGGEKEVSGKITL